MINKDPLILSIETATLGGSVWLGQGSRELASKTGDPAVSQSNSLLSDINDCLQQAGVSLPEIELFACASGPGSFTGLRIGIATLKGMAATLDRSCVGVPTLEAVAHAAGTSPATVALLPAGRGEVFAQMFSVSNSNGEAVNPIDTAAHLSPAKLIEKYGSHESLVWSGPGAHLHRNLIEQGATARGINFRETALPTEGTGWLLAPVESNLAKHVAALATRALGEGLVHGAELISAIYVRPSDAELNEPHK